MSRKIIIKSAQQIVNIRDSGKYLTEILNILYHEANIWVSLIELEEIAEKYMRQHKVKGAFKWYEWFPANLCLSVNDCLVHWIPDDYILRSGDLLKIDCWVDYKWWISDAAVSVILGGEFANPDAYNLVKATKEALDLWIQEIKPNAHLMNFSRVVFDHMTKINDYSVIENLTWHGVGQLVHEAPHIYNVPHPSMKKIAFKQNMVIALEPITALNSVTTIEQPWNHRNLYTRNWDLWAQWEYTVLVTDKGHEVLAGVQEDLFL